MGNLPSVYLNLSISTLSACSVCRCCSCFLLCSPSLFGFPVSRQQSDACLDERRAAAARNVNPVGSVDLSGLGSGHTSLNPAASSTLPHLPPSTKLPLSFSPDFSLFEESDVNFSPYFHPSIHPAFRQSRLIVSVFNNAGGAWGGGGSSLQPPAAARFFKFSHKVSTQRRFFILWFLFCSKKDSEEPKHHDDMWSL